MSATNECLRCGLPGARGLTHACMTGEGASTPTANPAGVPQLTWTADGTFWLELRADTVSVGADDGASDASRGGVGGGL